MRVDERLAHGDLSLVSDIAQMKFGEKSRFNLSFASKYCSWHQPTRYQIYDGVVNQMIWSYQERDAFSKFARRELRDYSRFMEIVEDFRRHYGLGNVGRKELDQFL